MFTIAICLVAVCLQLGNAARQDNTNDCLELSENVPQYSTCTCHLSKEGGSDELDKIKCVDKHFDEATARLMLNATSQYALNVKEIV